MPPKVELPATAPRSAPDNATARLGAQSPPRNEIQVGVPVPPPTRPAPRPQGRDFWLRAALYGILLGAILTVIAAWMVARQPGDAGAAAGLVSYYEFIVPMLAAAAVAGVWRLERQPVAGVLLLLLGTGLSLAAGGIWLAPGALCGCIWAARHSRRAHTLLGFLLLLPGVAAVYYGILGAISFATGIELTAMPGLVGSPLSLGQALAPLELLPVALLGAWMLVRPRPGD